MSQDSRFCHRCGTALPPGSTFCPRCGTPVALGSAPPGPSPTTAPPPASWEKRHEKQEKHEKNEKNEKNEKGRGGDLAGALTGGLVLVLLGVLFYLAQTGAAPINWGNWIWYFLIGMGCILIVQGVIRSASRGHVYAGSFIGGIVMIVIGVAFVSSSNFALWPLLLVVLGVAAMASAVLGRRRTPVP